MDEKKRLLFERKRDIQAAKNLLKLMDGQGLSVLGLFEKEALPVLTELLSRCRKAWHTAENTRAAAKLPLNSSIADIVNWVQEYTGIAKGKEYFFLCGGQVTPLWGKVRITETNRAIETLWLHDRIAHKKCGYCPGFLVAADPSGPIYEACCDSSDEYHYLIYIFPSE